MESFTKSLNKLKFLGIDMKQNKKKIDHKIIILSLCLSFLYCGSLFAIETGEIQGKVVDETGMGLPGVEINAKSPSLQGQRTVLSSKNGDFLFPLLPVGNYTTH